MIVNLQAAGIRRMQGEQENKEAVSLALAPFLRRYPKSIKIEPVGEKSQNLTIQVDASSMDQAQEMSAYFNNQLLVNAGFTSSKWKETESASDADAVTKALVGGLQLSPSLSKKKWWEFWK